MQTGDGATYESIRERLEQAYEAAYGSVRLSQVGGNLDAAARYLWRASRAPKLDSSDEIDDPLEYSRHGTL
jgi:hypothetical protein